MKWIKSTDKLPPEGKWVLGWFGKDTIIVLVRLCFYDFDHHEIIYNAFTSEPLNRAITGKHPTKWAIVPMPWEKEIKEIREIREIRESKRENRISRFEMLDL